MDRSLHLRSLRLVRAARERDWEEVEHVALTRDFLRDPEAFLRRL